jgi:hypothetical protein
MDFITSVSNSNIKIKEIDIKEEEDPLLVTFQDMQEMSEVCIYVQLRTFHRDVHECILSLSCPSISV